MVLPVVRALVVRLLVLPVAGCSRRWQVVVVMVVACCGHGPGGCGGGPVGAVLSGCMQLGKPGLAWQVCCDEARLGVVDAAGSQPNVLAISPAGRLSA